MSKTFYFWLSTCLFFSIAQAAPCPTPPAPIRDIEANTFYIDSNSSVVDPALQQQYHAKIAPLEEYLRQVASFADQKIAKQDAESGRCALTWLATWAEGRALLGEMRNARGNTQADYERKWLLSGLAIAYLKVVKLATPAQQQTINPWLQEIADLALAFFDNPKHKRNNHYYWVGLAQMATGVATNSPRHREAGRKVFNAAIADIDENGSMPMEMARKQLALHYHNFSLLPIVTLAAIGQNESGVSLTNPKLQALIQRVEAGFEDPAWFAQQTQQTQKAPSASARCWQVFLRPSNQACRYNHLGGDANLLMQLLQGLRKP